MTEKHPIWPAMSLAEATAQLTAPGARFETVPVMVRGVPMLAWKNVPATARELVGAMAAFGPRECLVYGEERIDYGAVARAAHVLAAALQARGLEKGDRVALVMRNLPEWPVIFLAGLLTGAILVPLNAHWTAAELSFALDDCGARFVLCDGERLERVRQATDATIIASRAEAVSGVTQLEDIIGAPGDWHKLAETAAPAIVLSPEDNATIFYTSGTTGHPKGALGTHRNLTTNIFATPFSSARNALRAGQPQPEPGRRRAILVAIPLFHVSACLASLLPSLAAGGKIVLMRKFEAGAALAIIARERITVTGGVPAVALALLEARSTHDLSSLELLSYGGAPSPSTLAGRIADALAPTMPGNGWGMTETSATCTIHSGRDYELRPESCGPALPVSAIKVTRDGRELPPGDVGELWAFGPNIVSGYWNRPSETAATFQQGWVRTGDLARIDNDGFCTIVDRAKDMVIRGGENIYCIEVEHVLAAHPQVIEAALVGLAHPQLGEVPAAMVRVRGALKEADLRAFAGTRLAPYKLPVQYLITAEPLPRNEGGKVMKEKLKAAFA